MTVIGVMPPGFHFMTVVEVWRPSSTALPTTLNGKRDARLPYIYAVGRLADGVTQTEAQAEIDAIVSRLAQQFPETNASTVVGLEPVQDVLLGSLGQMFLLVMAAVLLVLLIACVNVANLLMARGVHRAREMALRLSLGATRWRVIRQLLIESLLLATFGGLCGFALAFYGVRIFARTIDEMMASWQNPPDFYLDFSIDSRVYLFTLATCVATALLFGLLPALQVSRTNANEVLKEGGRSATPGIPARRWTAGLMASQLALTLVLLAGAAVVGRNFDAIYRAAHTTDTSGIVTMRLSLAAQKYPTADHIKTFYRRLDERLATMPELTAVTVASDIPFVPTLSLSRQLLIDGRPWAPLEKPPTVSYLYTGPRYFETFRLPIRRGRALDDRDALKGQEGVVVNERFATLFFPTGDVVGQRIQLTNAARPDLPTLWYTIVGVSATVPHAMRQEQEPVVYARVETEPVLNRFASIAARGPLDTAAIVTRLRQEMAHVDPSLPGYWVQTLDQVLASSRWVHRVFGLMLALLAVIALTLASVGLYAVTAHGVAQRAHEIGVRMALGADAPSIVRLFALRTFWQLGIGLALGGALVLASGRFLQSLLAGLGPIEVSTYDPLTLASVAALLMSVAALACILPARRAARLDPVVALRND